MKYIDLENHFFTQDYIDFLRSKQDPPLETVESDVLTMWYTNELCSPRSFEMDNKMLDISKARIKAMDENGVAMQGLSLSPPGVQCFDPADGVTWAKKINDALAGVVRRYPDRFFGIASVPVQSPEEAADELKRAVTELGLKGAMIESHARNEYLDNKKFWPVFEMAENLDVPICFHPEIPSQLILKGYADDYGFELAGPPLGYGSDLHLHSMRLIYSGLFDRYPRLKIILGHMGEGLPFWLTRMDAYWIKPWKGEKPRIEKRPSDYVKSNFIITFSGMFFMPAFLCAYLALGADRIAFAVDYPYEKTEEAIKFINQAPIPEEDKEKICFSNAVKLFKL